MTKVLISILNWNNAPATISCVNSILENVSYPKELYKIVIVDNASIDDSYSTIKTNFPEIEVIRSGTNNGYAAGHFLSYKAHENEDFDLFWILNNDLVINDSTLPELINAYNQHGDAIYGSMSVKSANSIEFAGFQEIHDFTIPKNRLDSYFGKDFKELINPHTYWTPQVYGFSIILPVNIIKKYGFLNQDYFMYHEESEYCFRLLLEHHIKSFIVQKSVVNHETSTSFKRSSNLTYIKDYYISRNNYLLLSRVYKYKKRSFFKQDIKYVWQLIYLLFPRKLLLNKGSDSFKKKYYVLLGKCDYYLNRLGRTIKPEDYI